MNNLCAGAELAHRIGDSVIKSGANGKDHITVMHRHIRLVKPVHSQHAQKLPVSGRVGTEPH